VRDRVTPVRVLMLLDGPSRRDTLFGPSCGDCKPTYNRGRFVRFTRACAVLEITADGLNRLRASMLSASVILLIFSSVSRFSRLAFSPLNTA